MAPPPSDDRPQAGRDPATKPKQFRVTGTDTTTGKKATILTTTEPAIGSVVTGRDPATGKTLTLKVTGRDPAT